MLAAPCHCFQFSVGLTGFSSLRQYLSYTPFGIRGIILHISVPVMVPQRFLTAISVFATTGRRRRSVWDCSDGFLNDHDRKARCVRRFLCLIPEAKMGGSRTLRCQ